MHFTGYVVYRLFLHLYWVTAHVLALFQPKTKKWLNGRKYQSFDDFVTEDNTQVIWFHTASTGEYEQAVPLIQALKKQLPDVRILLTFFSPSGYEMLHEKSVADDVYYLPFDYPEDIKIFLNTFNPKAAIFIKYEFWYHAVSITAGMGIPVYLVSARFRKSQLFFKFYGKLFRELLQRYKHIFVQDKESEKLLKGLSVNHVTVSGDTRFARVIQIKNAARKIEKVSDFATGMPLLVAGSTWPADESLLANFALKFPETFSGKFLIVPHEVDEKHIRETAEKFEKRSTTLFTDEVLNNEKVMILNAMGYLSSAYAYARYAYVGGGFGKGIHNVLEAAVYGIPVFFGPNNYKFKEATDLINLGSAFEITNYNELNEKILFFESNPDARLKVKQVNEKYFADNAQAVSKIMKELEKVT